MAARAAGADMRQPRTTTSASGRVAGAGRVELRVDVLRAIRAADVAALDLWLVVASDVGELRPKARRTPTGIEEALVRRNAGELVRRLAEGGVELELAEVRAHLRATRERLSAELEARGLLEPSAAPRLRLVVDGAGVGYAGRIA